MRNWKPMFFENSKVPVILSKVSPITIGAISLCGFVFSRGEMSERTKRHETIHFQQQLELLFIPFFLLYGLLWVIALFENKFDGTKAYLNIAFEREAYENDADADYLTNRKRFAWVKFLTENQREI